MPHFSFPFLSLPVRNVQLRQISNQPDPTQPNPTQREQVLKEMPAFPEDRESGPEARLRRRWAGGLAHYRTLMYRRILFSEDSLVHIYTSPLSPFLHSLSFLLSPSRSPLALSPNPGREIVEEQGTEPCDARYTSTAQPYKMTYMNPRLPAPLRSLPPRFVCSLSRTYPIPADPDPINTSRLEEQELGAEEGLRVAVAGERGGDGDDGDDGDDDSADGGDDDEASAASSSNARRGRGESGGVGGGGGGGGEGGDGQGQLVVREQATALVGGGLLFWFVVVVVDSPVNSPVMLLFLLLLLLPW